ncbi:hypothetical protein [Mucilaginibacter psychrotolerans]|uniref:hypothetical protein n=1 Tax=Mucilaginibacter psychrotolerans TaxID=1524096 RepID=UPI001864F7E9|nr:hypothetical protein [Mucilaginibacter psychrotolerans]
MKELSDFIKSKITIDGLDLEIILSNFKTRQVRKGQLILKRGQVAYQYFYIKSGALRFFFGEFDE